MKLLVADDDLVSRLVLRGAVEGLGHQCLVAEDGEAAWQLLVEHEPDVLITDQMMPGVDGLELCRRVRGCAGRPYTYIILVTSLGARANVLAGMEAGADDYLIKPVDPFDLRTRLVAAQRVTVLHAQLRASRAELARLARTDALTQLPNRRSLDDDLGALHERSERNGRPYSLALVDVDHFKAYNDTLGHQAGDEALRMVAGTLAAHTRRGELVYRFGGEEFLVVLPEHDLDEAVSAAERFRQGMEARGIAHPAVPSPGGLTISVGLAAFDPATPRTSRALLRAADDALYRAKAAGRNRVVADGPDGPPPSLPVSTGSSAVRG